MRRIDGTSGTPFPALSSDCRGLPAESPHGWFMGFGGRAGRRFGPKEKDLVDSQIRLYGRSSGGSVPDNRVRAIPDNRLWPTTSVVV